MSDIGAVTSGIGARPIRTTLAGVPIDKASSPASDAGALGGGGRADFDTVSLSEAGQDVVNLARGKDLAEDIRAMPVDENFALNLRNAVQDIFRITRLFGETIKSAFQLRR